MNMFSRRQAMRWFGGLAGAAGALDLFEGQAIGGEDPNNYRVVGDRYTTQARASDGRVFVFGAAECLNTRTNQVDAIIVWIERPGRVVERRVHKKASMPEFTHDLAARGYSKSLLGDFLGGIRDIGNAIQSSISHLDIDYIKNVVRELKGVVQAVKDLITKILALYGALSGKIAQKQYDAGGAEAVARHALNIRDVCSRYPNAPTSQKFLLSLERTLQVDPMGRLTVASALAIIKS